ncbi:MAG: purine-binding chemotaxis protein CheW [Syntrophaceae bacterium]|mgnify:FL=1|nr:purine-binding chemotaxis protein CheW [Syntrophaceae bacterium]
MSVAKITESRQYLAFKMDGEVFALDVSQVREILDYTKITKVPQTPDYMKGVINLRGAVVPVVDMRLKFNMPSQERTVNTCIIVVEVHLEEEQAVLGVLVDSVQAVFGLEPSKVEPPPRIGTKLNTDFILGMGKRGEDLVIILDVDRIFSLDEMNIANAMREEVA